MTQNRIVCPRCGANNFDTVSVCWSCQSPLRGAAGPAVTQPSPSSAQPSGIQRDQYGFTPAAAAVSVPAQIMGDRGAAKRAALWLSWTFPYFGLPIGWSFVMTSDPNLQEIGRYCVLWSGIALVVHTILLTIAGQALIGQLGGLLPVITHLLPNAGSAGGAAGGGGTSGL